MRDGDFSALLGRVIGADALGGTVAAGQIFDPSSIRPDGKGGSVRTAFPGNIIPLSRFSPVSAKLGSYWPRPTIPNLLANNFVGGSPLQINKEDNYFIRIDHALAKGKTSSMVSMAPRIDRYASRAKIYVGMHNHSSMNPDEFASPESFDRAMNGASQYIGINLDIGHFVAAGFDPLELIEKRHDKIFSLHLKDRKKTQGPNVPFGQGDTPIRTVLQLLKRKGYRIPANIEYEYKTHRA
jgi:hypothetical protein